MVKPRSPKILSRRLWTANDHDGGTQLTTSPVSNHNRMLLLQGRNAFHKMGTCPIVSRLTTTHMTYTSKQAASCRLKTRLEKQCRPSSPTEIGAWVDQHLPPISSTQFQASLLSQPKHTLATLVIRNPGTFCFFLRP
jgi:hypothetical protein